MAQFYEMPQASPTMTVGTLVAWRKSEGDTLEPQDVIAEVETDKATMDIEVFDAGVVLKLLVDEGAEVPPGMPIAIVGERADEDIADLLAAYAARLAEVPAEHEAPAVAEPAPVERVTPHKLATPAAEPALEGGGLALADWRGQPLDDSIMEPPRAFTPATPRVRASPLARKIARAQGIDLSTLTGTGAHGRIEKADLVGAAPSARSLGPVPADQAVRNSQMRKTIARRLTDAYLGAPVFFLTANFRCDALVAFRGQLKAGGIRISYNDVVLKAVALALREVPECNATWGDKTITRLGRVDVGMAVALPDGLITPVVRQADRMPLAELAQQTRELAARAREMKLGPDEYTGSTFTVSNLGMMQIEQFTAILNPPEAGILAVGSLQQEPVVLDGELTVEHRMRVTMTCDHRVIDGALGARFLQAVRRYIENPVLCLV